MKKITKMRLLAAVLAFVVMMGVMDVPKTCAAADSRSVVSNEYTQGNYKYFFEGIWSENTLYLCRTKKDGTAKEEICKLNHIEWDYVGIDGFYNNTFYFTTGFPSGGSLFCTVNIKTKKYKQTNYPGVDSKISNTQFILNISSFNGDWTLSPTYYFNAKTGKYKLLAKYCDFYSIQGNTVIYGKSSYDAAYKTHTTTLYKYNLKSNKTAKLKKIKKFYQVQMVKSNFLTYYTGEDTYRNGTLKICAFGKADSSLKDGTYDVKKDVYAHVSGGYLDIYGQIKQTSSKKSKAYKHYRMKIGKSCKFYAVEDGDKDLCDKAFFNEIHDSVLGEPESLRIGLRFVVKNGVVTKVVMSN